MVNERDFSYFLTIVGDSLLYLSFTYLLICVAGGMCVWRSENSVWELVVSFHHVSSEDGIQAVRLEVGALTLGAFHWHPIANCKVGKSEMKNENHLVKKKKSAPDKNRCLKCLGYIQYIVRVEAKSGRAKEVAQWAKALDLSLILGTHTVEGENQLRVILCQLHVCCGMCSHTK